MLARIYEREEDVLSTRASKNLDAFEEHDEEAEGGSQPASHLAAALCGAQHLVKLLSGWLLI